MTQDYPCSTLEEKISSTDVSIIGVNHVKEFFKRYENFFYDKISCSDAIVLEQTVGGEFYDSEFFNELGMIAHKQKKRVYQTDPVNLPSFFIDLIQFGLGYSLLCSFDIQSVLGLYLSLGSLPGSEIRYLLTTKKDANGDLTKVKNGYEFLMYGDTDYRNLIIANGIEKICAETKGIQRLACFHGEAHSKPIRTYLKNPTLRKIKRLLYLPTYELVSKTKVREYTPADYGWMLSKQF